MAGIQDYIGWRDLPFHGPVAEVRVVGNGKDSVLQVYVPEGSAFAIPLSEARLSVTCSDGVVIETQSVDDLSLQIRYRPAAGRRMELFSARVNYPGTEEHWSEDCNLWKRMSRAKWPTESSWAVEGVEMVLGTRGDSEP